MAIWIRSTRLRVERMRVDREGIPLSIESIHNHIIHVLEGFTCETGALSRRRSPTVLPCLNVIVGFAADAIACKTNFWVALAKSQIGTRIEVQVVRSCGNPRMAIRRPMLIARHMCRPDVHDSSKGGVRWCWTTVNDSVACPHVQSDHLANLPVPG
jgi:hypothetical protein